MQIDSTVIVNKVSVKDIATTYAIYFTFLTVFIMLFLCVFVCCVASCSKDNKNINKNSFFKKRFDLIRYTSIYTSDRSAIIANIRAFNQESLDANQCTANQCTDNASGKMFGINKRIAKELKIYTQKNKYNCFGCCRSHTSIKSDHDIKTSSDQIPKNINTNSFNGKEHKKDIPESDKTILLHDDMLTEKIDDTVVQSMEIKTNESKISVVKNATTSADNKIYLHYSFDNMNDSNDSGANTVLANINDDSQNVFRDLEAFVNIVLKTVDPKEVVILLKISSPGGYAYKFELAYTHLMRLRSAKFQLIALVDDICASGGYMLASACNTIICAEYANIGSIGVVASMYNYYDLIKKIGVVEKTLTTGAYKRPFPSGEPFEQEHTDRVNESIQEVLEIFKNIVQKSRNLTDDEIKEILSAKVWYGKKALEKKLVDRICSSSEYLDELLLTKNQVFLVCRKPLKDELSFVQSLLKLSVPALLSYIPTLMTKLPKPYQLGNFAKNE